MTSQANGVTALPVVAPFPLDEFALLTAEEASSVLHGRISKTWLEDKAAEGRIPRTYAAGRLLFSLQDLRDLMAQQRVIPTTPKGRR